MKKFLSLIIISLMIFSIFSCSGKNEDVKEEQSLKSEIKKETIMPISIPDDAVTTSSGLKYVEIKEGDGAQPQKGNTVVVHYTGWLLDGKKFDSSVDRNQKFEFVYGVGQVIRGWDEGLSTMKVGGKRKLFIPADLGYGSRGAGGVIPPNATLVFDVELFDIK
ncbi:MAG: FKBP-type peptidyl-prolyl cis-trans isomerase [Calditrichaceae bacterium]